jgi:hypothetical protein
MSNPTVKDLMMLAECEAAIFKTLGDNLDLVLPLVRRMCVTFQLNVTEVFPDVAPVGALQVPSGPSVSKALPVDSSSVSSKMEEKKDSSSGAKAADPKKGAAPVEEKLSDLEKSTREFAGMLGTFNDLPGLLESRKNALPESKGSLKTHLTKLKSVCSDLDALITVVLKARSSSEISCHALASFNNTLLAFVTQCDKILTVDQQPLPSAALRLIKQLFLKKEKLCKVWHLARNLSSTNQWKINGDLGNITEIVKQDDEQSGVSGDAEW